MTYLISTANSALLDTLQNPHYLVDANGDQPVIVSIHESREAAKKALDNRDLNIVKYSEDHEFELSDPESTPPSPPPIFEGTLSALVSNELTAPPLTAKLYSPHDTKLHKSKIEGPVALVWKTCNMMADSSRKEVLAALDGMGIAYYTARTQYQRWFKQRKAVAKPQP